MDTAGSPVRYNAPGIASIEIIEAECQGVRHRIVLTVIEPEFSAPDLKVARGSGPPPENNPVVAELNWMPYYGPSSVNFYRARTCESGAPSEGASGYFVGHPVKPHDPNSCRLEETVVPGKGNPQYGQGDWPIGYACKPYDYDDGYVFWPIVWGYSCEGVGPVYYHDVPQEFFFYRYEMNGVKHVEFTVCKAGFCATGWGIVEAWE